LRGPTAAPTPRCSSRSPPGAYTAVVKGVAGTTAIALIEIYDANID
jgi:hypothetical protein